MTKLEPYSFPKIVIEKHEGIYVVREDLLEGGSKRRFIDRYVREEIEKGAEEFVFGGAPATGYAPMSLTLQAKHYGANATFFMAKRSLDNLHEYQKKALEYGANIQWVNMGMLNVTLSRARKYYEEDTFKRRNFPLGLEDERVLEDIETLGREIREEWKGKFSEIWTVGSSGTLTRGLQRAFPELEVHVISVGHKMSEREIGRAKFYKSPYKFDKPIKPIEAPPFPSAPTYDAKAWPFLKEFAKPNAMFWNVGK
tara:strand:+ start:3148 stop:3909 length:762 start_codon:yes stop_codon:yes gene_type:complete